MSTSDNCKDSASNNKSNDDVCELEEKLQNMSTADVSVCANCGKEDANNICNKCKQVKYCNAVCKKVHKKKHKKQCEEHVRRVAEEHNEELRIAAELHDKELFKQSSSQYDDCPICFIRMPSLSSGWRYQTCCGKVICSGCVYAPVYDNQGNKVDNQKCPFCRIPTPYTDKEAVEREKKRVDLGDAIAIHNLGVCYSEGDYGYQQDRTKALELYHRAAELGYAGAYNNIGHAYEFGLGVGRDKKKAYYYYGLAAMGGNEIARCALGIKEEEQGNMDRALKHYMIAVEGGDTKSLDAIKEMYSDGDATKEDYTKALQLYQEYLSEIKSPQRDKAAAAREYYRYY